ncbi:MAG: site-2 protease family protein [Oscillospiraceae bacterium]|jgi:stage IV sporulation protein FB|nr:site-2 protease family protein [Oscillospiraceae bacterium]
MGIKSALRKLEISASAAIIPAVVYLLDAGYLLLLTAVAVAAHELGHYAALRLAGGEVRRVRLSLTGVAMEYGGLGYGGEIAAALLGPGASAALAVVSALGGRVFAYEPAYHLAGLSLLLGAFNLLPAFPLDGGRALYGAVARLFGLRAADVTRRAASAAIVAALLLGGVQLLRVSRNPTLLLAALWLTNSCCARARDMI